MSSIFLEIFRNDRLGNQIRLPRPSGLSENARVPILN
jgi:hypothetical protein